MEEKNDFIDITPTEIGGAGSKGTVFQETEILQINDNPDGLTKEGIEEKIALWKKSANGHVVIKYQTMLKRCSKIKPSGKTHDGKIILSYDLGDNPKWVKDDPNYVPKKETKK